MPKNNLERIVIDHIKNKILNDDVLKKLTALFNEDFNQAYSLYQEKLEVLDVEVKDVSSKLTMEVAKSTGAFVST